MKQNTQSGTYIRICKLTKKYKQNQSNMKKYDKRNSHTSSKLHMIYRSSNNDRHPVTRTFTPLHYTCQHFISSHLKLHPTSLHYTYSYINCTQVHFTTLSFDLTPFKISYCFIHLRSLHFTSLHFTALLSNFHHTSTPFTSPCLLLLSQLSKNFRFTMESP
jgi:hypothetical protein